MTIHGWGTPIYISQLSDEFGNFGAPYYMSQYWSGAGKVPAGAVGYPSGGGAVAIPASGYISLNNFYGAANYIAQYVITSGTDGSGVGYSIVGFAYGSTSRTDIPFTSPPGVLRQVAMGGGLLRLWISNNPANSGWETMHVTRGGSTWTYARASATYATTGIWDWTLAGEVPFVNGEVTTVAFRQ